MRHLLATSLAIAVLGLPWLAMQFPESAERAITTIERTGKQIAAVILSHNPKTVAEIQKKYKSSSSQKKVRILLVPGHEPGDGGTQFGAAVEHELVVTLAEELARFLQQNSRYEVYLTRNDTAWNPALAEYLRNNWNDIIEWQKLSKQEVTDLMQLGQYQKTIPALEHQSAPTDMAVRLYGINKWAGEHDVDIIVHIHLNDYPRKPRSQPGSYSGFSIYVPERQYYNSQTTHALADTVFKRLEKYNHVSDLPGESEGIIEDQELIAVGSYNTVDAASMLIEYGYIYEPQFVNPMTRQLALKDLAYQTYLGITDFFDPERSEGLAKYYDTVAVPYQWTGTIAGTNVEGPHVYALQTALLLDGVYPPSDKDKNDCPRTGRLGPCTKRALGDFQRKYGITGESEMAGVKTVELLNRTYGVGAL